MDSSNSSCYISLEKTISTESNNGRLDIFCENSAKKVSKMDKSGSIPCKEETAEILSLWRSFETDSMIL